MPAPCPGCPAPEDGVTTSRLDAIPTDWSLLRNAFQGTVTLAGPARNALVLRYNRAIRRYLVALLKAESDAEDVAQEVLANLLTGKFAAADADKGRFRDYLKRAVRNTALNFLRKEQRRKARDRGWFLRSERPAAAPPSLAGPDDSDPEWTAQWRRLVLEHTFERLRAYQHGRADLVYFELMKARADQPDADNKRLAERLHAATGRRLSDGAFRAMLLRARRKFAELLLEEVASGLNTATPLRVEEELVELGLMEYVRDFLPQDWHTRGELREPD